MTASLKKALLFAGYGAVGGAAGMILSEPFGRGSDGSLLGSIVNVAVWMYVAIAAISAALLAGQEWYLRRTLAPARLPALLLSVALCGVAGLVAGAAAQFLYGVGGANNELLRIVCWGLAGALSGFGVSFRIPNLGAGRGFGGGCLGGLCGAVAFIVASVILSDVLGRFVGLATIGFGIGLMVMLAEALFAEAGLEISYGKGEQRRVSLGAEPIAIGGDAAHSTIFVRGAAPVALRYRFAQGQIVVEDGVTGQAVAVGDGDQRQVGPVTVTVRARGSGPPTAAGGTPAATRPGTPAGALETGRALATPPGPVEREPVPGGGLLLRWASGPTLPLAAGATLTAATIRGATGAADPAVVGRVTTHPSRPDILGLTNCTAATWRVQQPDGEIVKIGPERSIRLARGTILFIGVEVLTVE